MKTISSNLVRFMAIVAVMAFLVSATPAAVLADTTSGVTLTVSVPALNVRGGPGTGYPILGALHQGDQRNVSGRDATGAWYQVPVVAGGAQLGWVYGALVQVSGDATTLPVVNVPAPVSTGAAASTSAAATGSSAAHGGTIVFQSSSGGPIYAINADGTNMHYLTDGMDPALSPDGKSVAFTRWNGNSISVSGELYVIGIDGTGERKVLGALSQPKAPSWSPDGTQVVINYQQGPAESTQKCFNFRGGKFCFTIPADPRWALKVINIADGTFKDVNHDFHSFGPSWDPANAWRVVAQGAKGLVQTDLNQNTILNITTDPADRAPIFSPDGSKIAESYWQTGNWEVHVLNADGSGATRLTQTPDTVLVDQQLQGKTPQSWNNAAPAWSPDGKQIAFLTDRTGAWEIWIMNADGSNQHPLLPNGLPNGVTLDYRGLSERVMSWR
jgi:dipeptidyl aminopeptidase/acylaminoacyl peptidase